MREHMGIFRGKRVDNGEWVEGNLVKAATGTVWIAKTSFCGSVVHMPEVDPDTVGEYTGLRDKNGKLIFEGDIVNIHVPNGFDMTGVVEYYDYGFEVRDEENGAYECLWYPPSVISILGNIHDNPELLKGGEGDG